jgi:glyoxylase-like metal-dependent hydrolase (beta-lactamase superfamily II)
MRPIDVRHPGNEHVICCWDVDGVLIDPGPQSCEATLLEALGGERPRALLLTHTHFDHAGAAGSLVRRWPELPVYVHEIGARHLADPERLVASATRIYGEENMHRLWGDVVPVPEANLKPLSGGERLLGAYRVEYTPGHASHHVSFLHEPSGRAFVGDVAGIHVPPASYVLAPTPPPDIDIEAWDRSIDLVSAWEPASLGITHWGPVEDPPAQLAAARERLHEMAELARDTDVEGFTAALKAQVERGAGETAEAYLQAAPPDMLFFGLERWHRKRSGA